MVYTRLLCYGVGSSLIGFCKEKWNWSKNKFTVQCREQPPDLIFNCGSKDIRIFGDIIISFDRRTKVPRWVCERFTANQAFDYGPEERAPFVQDDELLVYYRTMPNDYLNYNFKPKPLASPRNHCNKLSKEACSLSTNMAPVPGFSRERDTPTMAENALKQCIESSNCFRECVYMFTGPMYIPREIDGEMYVEAEIIGDIEITVPTHYFKFIIGAKADNPHQYWFRGFYWDNVANAQLFEMTNIEQQLERAAGLKFFPGINRDAIQIMEAYNGEV